MIKHINSKDECPKCNEIFDRYPGFNQNIRSWFNALRSQIENCHISCAGRGRAEQEDNKRKGSSDAVFGASAHNYNMAIDIFFIIDGKPSWDEKLYNAIGNSYLLIKEIYWYGHSKSKRAQADKGHFELKGWQKLKNKKLVE